jgi:glycosyltransferase involved in cell wall biosynthesis
MKKKKNKKPMPTPKKAPQFVPVPQMGLNIQQTPKFDGPLPTIGLSIIVKNESKVIERMLNSVYHILDYYCVIDTGSTDGTQDIIIKFFEEKGIPGEVIDHPWVNFEDARNTAIKAIEGKCDYGFWIDADEQLMIEPSFNKEIFKRNLATCDGANVKIYYGGQNYFRMQFFKTGIGWYWYGPVHEVLIRDEEDTDIASVEGLSVLVTPDGNSWTAETQQQKYEGHAKILEDYVAKDEKKDPRWLFYLAQSYRDANTPENYKKSIEWYQKRIDVGGGYWEEVYFSSLMVANLKSMLGYPKPEVIEGFLSCGKHNLFRTEHLMPIIAYYHSIKEYEIAYIYGLRVMQTAGKSPFPNATLFVDESAYTWKSYDLHSLSCWYSGRKAEAKAVYTKLMEAVKRGIVPQDQVARLEENKKYFLQ